jgi:glycosyltransferase involved in cell wall biosynthesis
MTKDVLEPIMSAKTEQTAAVRSNLLHPAVLMLLTNAYDPDPRVRQEALALIRKGCRVRILAWDRDLKSPALETMEGVEVERVFLPSLHGRGTTQLFFYTWLYLKMFWKGWKSSFDVVHCHDLDTLPLGFALGKLKGKPIVYDSHESFVDMLEGSVHPMVRRMLVSLETFLIRRVNLLITVGEKLRLHFVERGARHSVVVGNWKRLEEFSRSDDQNREIRRKLHIPDSAMVVVCIAQLFIDRKVEELLDAIDMTRDVHLIIGGKGALEELVKTRAANNPRIHYIGFVAAIEIPAYTCAGDVVYYGLDEQNPNARFSAPNKLFEALAAGKPMITADFGEIGQVVRNSSCGLILPKYSGPEIRQALERLQEDKLRNALADNARSCGRSGMNWEKGEEVLYREYSAMLPLALKDGLVSGIEPAERAEVRV